MQGEAAGAEGVLLGLCAPGPGIKTPVGDLPPSSRGLHLANQRFSPESQGLEVGWAGKRCSGNRCEPGARLGRFPAPPPPREGKRVRTTLRDPTVRPWPSGARTPKPQLWPGVETQPLCALRQGTGAGKGTKSQPAARESDPVSESYCSSHLRLRWTLVPPGGEGELTSRSWVFIYLGRGRAGKGRGPGKGRVPYSRATPSPARLL